MSDMQICSVHLWLWMPVSLIAITEITKHIQYKYIPMCTMYMFRVHAHVSQVRTLQIWTPSGQIVCQFFTRNDQSFSYISVSEAVTALVTL